MKRKLWLIPALITGLCMVLSFIVGHYGRWKPLGRPPEPAVEIVRASGSAVVVRTASNKFFRCVHGPRGTSVFSQDCEWEEINLSDFGPGALEEDELCGYFLPPGWVTDRFYFCSTPHWRYVVLITGSVWGYHSETDHLAFYWEALRFLYCFPLGTAGGFLLGIITYGLLYWRRRRAAKSR